MTEKLYYQDNMLDELNAEVLFVSYDNGISEVVLNKTIFYPEGGGQPSDRGFVNGCKVIDVQNKNDIIVHYVQGEIKKGKALLKLDFKRRYDLMQQHTGQHLLSQVVMNLFSFQTLSFHLGDSYSTIEIDSQNFTDKQLRETELELCERIFMNMIIKTYFVENESEVPFRKPPKVKSNIRVVEIDQFDFNACGGIHLNRTGELGLVKIIKKDKVRGNMRLYFVCGYRALNDYSLKQNGIYSLQQQLSATPQEVISIVEKLKKENLFLKKEIVEYKNEFYQKVLEKELAENSTNICAYFKNASIKELRDLVNVAKEKNKNAFFYSDSFCVIFSVDEEKKLSKISGDIFLLLKGKGGGSGNTAQGKILNLDSIEKAKEVFINFFQQRN